MLLLKRLNPFGSFAKPMKILRQFALLVFIAFTLVSFTADASSSATNPRAKIDPNTKAHGERFVKLIAERNADAWVKLFDVDALSAIAFKDTPLSDKEKAAAKRGFSSGLARSAKSMMVMMERNRNRPKLLISLPTASGSSQLLRLDSYDEKDQPAGHTYIRLTLNAKGELVDYLDYMAGEWASASVRKFVAITMESGTMLEKVLGVKSADSSKALKHAQAYSAAMQQQDFKAALAELRAMPKEFQDLLAISTLEVTAAQNIDEPTYRKSLASLAKKFQNDPNVQLILLDHYFFEKQFDAGIKALEIFERQVIEDGATNVLKCTYHDEAGRKDNALASCERATQVEPDFDQGWWGLIVHAIAQGKTAKAVQAMTGYENQFKLKLTEADLKDMDGFAKLKASTEYKAWTKLKR
jgi:hypothetical protein